MELTLLKGNFIGTEAIDLLRSMVDVKIKFHESKINAESTEEEVKMRETRIKELQNQLSTVVANIQTGKLTTVNLEATIQVN